MDIQVTKRSNPSLASHLEFADYVLPQNEIEKKIRALDNYALKLIATKMALTVAAALGPQKNAAITLILNSKDFQERIQDHITTDFSKPLHFLESGTRVPILGDEGLLKNFLGISQLTQYIVCLKLDYELTHKQLELVLKLTEEVGGKCS